MASGGLKELELGTGLGILLPKVRGLARKEIRRAFKEAGGEVLDGFLTKTNFLEANRERRRGAYILEPISTKDRWSFRGAS